MARRLQFVVSGLSFLFLAGQVVPQDPAFPSYKDLSKDWLNLERDFNGAVTGKQPTVAKTLQEAAAAGARWHIFRFNYPDLRNDPEKMKPVFAEIDSRIFKPLAEKNADPKFAQILAVELVKACKEVLKFKADEPDNRVGLIYLGMILPKLAKLKLEPIGAMLVEIVRDPAQHDMVKLYALRALADYEPARPFTANDKGAAELAKKKLDMERVAALKQYLERPAPDKDASPEEVEAHRYVRRECIRALAGVGIPAVDVSLRKSVEGVAIYPLLSVLADPKTKDALNPPPSVTEKLEAAIAIGNMKILGADPLSLYQADVSVYLIGQRMAEVIAVYRKDQANVAVGKNAKPPIQPAILWKAYAQRLWDAKAKDGALENLIQQTAKSPAAQKNAIKLLDTLKPHLEAMRNHDKVGPVDDAKLKALLPADLDHIFKGLSGPAVVTGGKAGQ